MLRTLLIATTLLAASGSALASDREYGRVVTVEPHFSVSFGSRHQDGFRVLYESGGSHYWTYTTHHPSHVIVLPPDHYRAQPVYYKPKHHRHDWHDDDWGQGRGHGRHHRKHHRGHHD